MPDTKDLDTGKPSLALYNEIDPYPAQWIRNLIAAGHVAPGVADERSIVDLTPADVAGPGQRHFFAGIAGWSLALRLAGIPDDAEVWTASCPCQPLSAAGQQRGFSDERHLWPVLFGLVRACRPPLLLGEQVSSRLGLEWLDLVCADLEGEGYTVRAADTCAASVGAPHIRQRLYFVAYSEGAGRSARWPGEAGGDSREPSGPRPARRLGHSDSEHAGRDGGTAHRAKAAGGRVNDRPDRELAGAPGGAIQLGDAQRERLEEDEQAGAAPRATRGSDALADQWRDLEWLPCSDGKQRPTQPGLRPLAHRVPAGVGGSRAKRLKGYGNAIVPAQAAAFIRAALTEAA